MRIRAVTRGDGPTPTRRALLRIVNNPGESLHRTAGTADPFFFCPEVLALVVKDVRLRFVGLKPTTSEIWLARGIYSPFE